MLTRMQLGSHSLVGVSVGGVYTSLCVPELDAIFDVGIAPRTFVGPGRLFLSHGHADHVGALPALIGVRGLSKREAPHVFLPAEIEADVRDGIEAFSRGQRRPLDVPLFPMNPGDERKLHADLFVRAFRTRHSVPSLGYELFRRVDKLRPEFHGLEGAEIQRRRVAGDDLFESVERPEVAYATDTLIDVLDENPHLYRTRTLILECTFVDEKKSVDEARQKAHVHLDEIIARAPHFDNQNLVLMHFSQVYQPREIHRVLRARLPDVLRDKVHVFAPQDGPWPG